LGSTPIRLQALLNHPICSQPVEILQSQIHHASLPKPASKIGQWSISVTIPRIDDLARLRVARPKMANEVIDRVRRHQAIILLGTWRCGRNKLDVCAINDGAVDPKAGNAQTSEEARRNR